jgi:hypothetical protein
VAAIVLMSITRAETHSSPAVQLCNACPPNCLARSVPIALPGGRVAVFDAAAAHALRLAAAPPVGSGAPLQLPDSARVPQLCQAFVPSLGLLLCAACGTIRVFDAWAGGGGVLPLLGSLSSYFNVRAMAASAVCLPDAGGMGRRLHGGGPPRGSDHPDALLVVAGGANGAQLHLWPLPAALRARAAGGPWRLAARSRSVPPPAPPPSCGVLAPPTFSAVAGGGCALGSASARRGAGAAEGAAVAGAAPALVDGPPFAPLDMLVGFSIAHVAVSPSGGLLALAAADGHVGLWEVAPLVRNMGRLREARVEDARMRARKAATAVVRAATVRVTAAGAPPPATTPARPAPESSRLAVAAPPQPQHQPPQSPQLQSSSAPLCVHDVVFSTGGGGGGGSPLQLPPPPPPLNAAAPSSVTNVPAVAHGLISEGRITSIALHGGDRYFAVGLWDGRVLVFARCDHWGVTGGSGGGGAAASAAKRAAVGAAPTAQQATGSGGGGGERRAPPAPVPGAPPPLTGDGFSWGGSGAGGAGAGAPQWWPAAAVLDWRGGAAVVLDTGEGGAARAANGVAAEVCEGGGAGAGAGAEAALEWGSDVRAFKKMVQAAERAGALASPGGSLHAPPRGASGDGAPAAAMEAEVVGGGDTPVIGPVPSRPPQFLYGPTLVAFWPSRGVPFDGDDGAPTAPGAEIAAGDWEEPLLLVACSRSRCLLTVALEPTPGLGASPPAAATAPAPAAFSLSAPPPPSLQQQPSPLPPPFLAFGLQPTPLPSAALGAGFRRLALFGSPASGGGDGARGVPPPAGAARALGGAAASAAFSLSPLTCLPLSEDVAGLSVAELGVAGGPAARPGGGGALGVVIDAAGKLYCVEKPRGSGGGSGGTATAWALGGAGGHLAYELIVPEAGTWEGVGASLGL